MIINKIALLVNDFIIKLYSNDIKFYQIIIGMFIFNFLIYSICNLIRISKKRYF